MRITNLTIEKKFSELNPGWKPKLYEEMLIMGETYFAEQIYVDQNFETVTIKYKLKK